MRYSEKALWHEPAEAAGIADYFQRLGVKNRKVCIHWTGSSKARGPTQAGPLAQHLPWLFQTYDGVGGRVPEKA